MLFCCPCGPWDTANNLELFTMRLWLCLEQQSQACSKGRWEIYIRGEDVLQQHTPAENVWDMNIYSFWRFFSFSLNFLLFSFCSSKELNEEAGPKGERGRNPLGTPMPPNPPSQGMCGSWMSVGSSFERRGLKSLSQRSPGCWAMNGVSCLLRRNGYH